MASITGATGERNELRRLSELFSGCLEGKGGLAVMNGPAASGKTALLQRFLDHRALSDAVVLSASGSRYEQDVPLGVVDQLAASPDLPAEVSQQVSDLLASGSAPWSGAPDVPTLMQSLRAALCELVERKPVVVAIDDAHFADHASLRCLAYLARRAHSARVLMLFVEANQLRAASALSRTELLHGLQMHRIQVEPLPVEMVADLIRQSEPDAPSDLAPRLRDVTGGNPLLLRALVDDLRRAGMVQAGEVVVGEAFADAVASCLFRQEPETRQVARGLAVIGERIEPVTLSRLLGMDGDLATRAIHLLNCSGLLGDGWFRHAGARAAVLASMLPEERAAMHARVAKLWQQEGRPATVVARHLTEADRIDAAWVAPTLREAAERALAGGDTDGALACLRAAFAGDLADQQRAETTAMLARVKWWRDPAEVIQHLPELVSGVRDRQLAGRDTIATINYLLWHGRIGDVANVFATLEEPDAATDHRLQTILTSLIYLYPGRAAEISRTWVGRRTGGMRDGDGNPSPDTDAPTAAVEVLRGCRQDDQSLGPVFGAVHTLAFTDRREGLPQWTESLAREVKACDPRIWRVLTSAARAEAALLRGDLTEALELARHGLTELPSAGWGVAVGWPIATIVRAASEAGDYETAAHHLSLPITPGVFDTPFGLKYLHARGKYHFATNRVHTALNDFHACGETMLAWNLDLPDLLLWRVDAAHAYLRLGQTRRCQELIHDQLRRLGEESVRLRGICLRVLSGALEAHERVAVLREAVRLLRSTPDRLEIAYALAELSFALQKLGERDPARAAQRSAAQLARQCGAQALLAALKFQSPTALPMPMLPSLTGPDGTAVLSEAERRVAGLAARGHTNREIAQRLYLTVSTVEQHLTRVYRKLRVTRRTELPSWLHTDPSDPTSR
ncbi:LuxR family transcriptional regulator [Micromonospora qiuiae]|uniref:LuxR family transcriptional regulator n=1 Tax=Micromonospora qiuiae TaxID=502268 RepID=A0ABQ4J977_9ACTN|nr:helix-turn-helix transcriptional regulator [Micromonospora qiuiae]GIJ26729.1 LuxR family transcriptional regulator [Micromonospora qiuiae]